jgi:hypothetical protein
MKFFPLFPFFHTSPRSLYVVDFQPWDHQLEILGVFSSLKKALECLDTYTRRHPKGYDMYNIYQVPQDEYLWDKLADHAIVYHNHVGRFYVSDAVKLTCDRLSKHGEHREFAP